MTTRKRKVTAEETTETVTVTRRSRRVAVEETDAVTEPIRIAPGWNVPALTAPELREQRSGQVSQALRRIWAGAQGDPAGDRETIRAAAYMLRAGPGASPLELLYGRAL